MHIFTSFASSAPCKSVATQTKQKIDPCKILKEIYKEVSELGSRKNENFIKREFHFDIDENDTNSEEHIVVLIYDVGDRERMVVQVTYFKSRGNNNIIKYAKDIRMVFCSLKKDIIEIEKCDYDDKEIKSILPKILEGIRAEKKLFKLIKGNK
ncbi:MAG: hypothetical protein GQ536_03975 [Candidatus Aminicenantes bacterium]|nr:hypothetical protein [Candidatus Aminicenantes bacterium]